MHDDVKNPDPRPLRVVVAPDSFKGSASATQVAHALAAGARSALGEAATIRAIPFADGGEGTLDAVLDAWGVVPGTAATTDALGRAVTARYGVSPDGRTVLVEAAEAYGLPLVADGLRPLEATSHGVGTLVLAALDGAPTAEEVVLFVGGSATTDGGAGLLEALGARFLDGAGSPVPPGGGGLRELARVDASRLHTRARDLRWRIACDVDNPLLGARGAAAVFGPQKGATSGDVAALEAGLARFADALAAATGSDVRDLPGAGASGGLPAGLSAVLGAELVPGGILVAEAVGLDAALADVDLVLTGEGRLDEQSLHGKVVDTVVRLAGPGAIVVVVAGGVELSPAQVAAAGIAAAFSIAPGPRTLAELSRDALVELEHTAAHACRLVAAARG
ncbi:glycerate kinase [Isoptericola hypogeus]|uniref:Glycerate kinase n=1 Tax=Isoptericola hypogeus TaxID=300179 RepID=A0ABN2IUS1_9MICO